MDGWMGHLNWWVEADDDESSPLQLQTHGLAG